MTRQKHFLLLLKQVKSKEALIYSSSRSKGFSRQAAKRLLAKLGSIGFI
jgi:hypothetical protein